MEIITIPIDRLTGRDIEYIGRMLQSIGVNNWSNDNINITIVTPFIDKIQEAATRLIVLAVDFSFTHSGGNQ